MPGTDADASGSGCIRAYEEIPTRQQGTGGWRSRVRARARPGSRARHRLICPRRRSLGRAIGCAARRAEWAGAAGPARHARHQHRRPCDGPDVARQCRPRISDDERLQSAARRHGAVRSRPREDLPRPDRDHQAKGSDDGRAQRDSDDFSRRSRDVHRPAAPRGRGQPQRQHRGGCPPAARRRSRRRDRLLRAHGIAGIRVDRSEEEIAEQFQQRRNLRAAGATETAAPRATRQGRPTRGGYAAYLRDPRDRATPDAAVLFLRKLWRGELLSPASTRHLLALLYAQAVPDRLRAGIPAGVRLADKCGTSYTVEGRTAAFNDMGILTWPDGDTVIVAAFLADSHAPDTRRDALFRTLARTVAADLRPTLPAARYDRARSSSSRIGHSGR